MKIKSSSKSRRVNRREFITGTAAGLVAAGLVRPATGFASEVQTAPAQFPGTGRYLYVTNNKDKRIDVG
jgi:hypothetical protein